MIKISEKAVEKVSEELIKAKYNLKKLFVRLKDLDQRLAEYIQCQADKSKAPLEIIGTGVVVHLLIEKQMEIESSSPPENPIGVRLDLDQDENQDPYLLDGPEDDEFCEFLLRQDLLDPSGL